MSSFEETLRITSELVRGRVEGAPREIQPNDRIQEDLGLDSLAVMEFAADVESRFDVSIPPEMYDRIHTVADVARAVIDLQNAR